MLQGKVYAIRIVYSIMISAMLGSGDGLCHGRPFAHGWLIIILLLYPHAGHLLFGRFDIRRLRGRIMLFIDGLIGGAAIFALGFSGMAWVFITAILLFNWMVIGGLTLLLPGILTITTGLLTMNGIANPAPATCSLPDWISGMFLAVYLLIVAGVIHKLVQELGQHQVALQAESDALRHARALAEGALFSALPPGTARQLSDHGTIGMEEVDGATLLLLQMDLEPPRRPALELLAAWFQASDMILARHGFEIVKTFGSRALILGRTATPESGISSQHEIDAYFRSHMPAGLFDGEQIMTRAVLSSGPVRIGPVQEERLNLELAGTAADALAELTDALADMPAVRLAITPAAHDRIIDASGYVLHPGDDRLPAHYRPAETATET